MATLGRRALEGGGSILFEAPRQLDGPVKAGRLSETVHDLPATLQAALAPVAEAAHEVLTQLRKASPDEIEVEFAIDLSFEAGAVITKSEASGHLQVTLTWKNDSTERRRVRLGACRRMGALRIFSLYRTGGTRASQRERKR